MIRATIERASARSTSRCQRRCCNESFRKRTDKGDLRRMSPRFEGSSEVSGFGRWERMLRWPRTGKTKDSSRCRSYSHHAGFAGTSHSFASLPAGITAGPGWARRNADEGAVNGVWCRRTVNFTLVSPWPHRTASKGPAGQRHHPGNLRNGKRVDMQAPAQCHSPVRAVPVPCLDAWKST